MKKTTKTFKIKPVESMPDFVKQEEQTLKHWCGTGIIADYLHKNCSSAKYFSFLDGPITANNPMGVHHGWGRTYKDLWQRYYNMRGFRQRFQSGFDCQGLWVEVEVEKDLEFKTKKDIATYGVAKFVQKCKDWVEKYSQIQTEQSKRLGYFMDWDNSYFTLSDHNNYMIWNFLKVCHRRGWLYKGKESVPWCPRCETAISQHEMLTEDYKEIVHDSVYLRLPLQGSKNTYLVVWTTTPWTIPANIAVAVDAKLTYFLVEDRSGKRHWVLKEAVARVFPGGEIKIIQEVKGKKLVGLKYRAPFDDLPAVKAVAKDSPLFHTVVPTNTRILPISSEEGTGLVHTAVSAGTEDFKLGKLLGLPMVPVIADNADYLPGLGFLSGQNAKKHPEIIIDYLSLPQNGLADYWLVRTEKIKHRYPACWRCKTELVWKVTDEWYIAMDKGKPTLRQKMKKVAKSIHWLPQFGLDRELDWLKNMHDWLISKKNRYWGLCLPIWECESCGNFEVIGSREELKDRAVSGWAEFAGKSPHKPYLDQVKIKCQNCGCLISRIEPVGNPWLDAGIVPFSTISKDNKSEPLYLENKDDWNHWFPADFITESFPGQFKNWFYSLIAMSTVLENKAPFRNVLGYATLLGEDGRPMHKSWGNALNFHDGANKIGVDVMRWMFTRQDPSQNLLFGFKSADLVRRQFHLMLWNSYRFVANNIYLDRPDLNQKITPKNILDQWILSRLNNLICLVTDSLNRYDSASAALHIEEFLRDFSNWYIRRSRERVGVAQPDQLTKLSFYRTSLEVLTCLSRLLAPFIPFLSDRFYTNLTGEKSVHLADWPLVDKSLIKQSLELEMAKVRQIVELSHARRKALELKVRQPLASLQVKGFPGMLSAALIALIKEEVNVKKVEFLAQGKELRVDFDTKLTPELEAEGIARDLVRQIQEERKKLKLEAGQSIMVTLPEIPKGFSGYIKNKTQALELKSGDKFQVEKAGK